MRAHSLIVLALLAVAPAVLAENFAECLLDNLPGVKNQASTNAALGLCRGKFPGAWASVQQGAGRGFFAKFDSGNECAIELGRDITVRQGAFLVAKSCKLLYDERVPGLFDDLE